MTKRGQYQSCCCAAPSYDCLIHSTIPAKSKAWPAWSHDSGTEPTQTGTDIYFSAPGRISYTHSEIKKWDYVSETFLSYSPSQPLEPKRLFYEVTLHDATSYVRVICSDTDANNHFKVHIRATRDSHLGNNRAKYPLVHVVLENKVSGTTDYWEWLADKWIADYRIGYTHADLRDWLSPAGYRPLTPVLSSSDSPVGAEWPIKDAQTRGSTVDIECVTGSATVSNLELYHDDNNSPVYTENAPQTHVTCATQWQAPYTATPLYGIVGTRPGTLKIVLPTLLEVPGSGCGSCDFAGGNSQTLYYSAADGYYDLDSISLAYGCETNLTASSIFYSMWNGANGILGIAGGLPDQDIYSNQDDFDAEFYPHHGQHLKLYNVGDDTDRRRSFNLAVVFDHLDQILYATSGARAGASCVAPAGTVTITLDDTVELS